MTTQPTLFPMVPAITTVVPASEEWETDPAKLSFLEYRNRLIWGRPDAQGSRACINRKLIREPFRYTVRQKDNEYAFGEDPKFGEWEKALNCGRSYLAGSDTPMKEFLRRHMSSLTNWQKHAYQWCLANPSRCLVLVSPQLKRHYVIKKRGEYVEIGLPHHEWGGERHWITKGGSRKVLVNVD
ncbi:hypothetical protein [Edaphobacter dinghuensis]|uniref:Uncharacterized protein n=1 Tax=Edaphobacter dinghuensis TaxID=1560005 RepID=A0A917M9T7_9BACT|nr:hypothetical protein [Edaphobacter dinghuensis]GGG86834.1 hypothetical protein GCM10011585_33500 [Edaphobacter dinghuensis]